MSDHFEISRWKSIQAASGKWYKAVELLGTGGNAATVLAYCGSKPTKGLLFAVKVFRRLSKPERRDAFLREAEILRGCDHPAIMKVYDEGVYYGNPFIVLEYLPKTLGEVMRSGASILEKVAYAFQLISALDYLDTQVPQLVHRDLKPPNIFIKGGSCVIGDFGLIKVLDEEDQEEDKAILKESIGVGMPFHYRTPDLVDYFNNVAPITTKSDIFQLGLVLAQLFTGWNPVKETMNFSDPVQLEPLGNIKSPMGGGIATLINRMLTYSPSERPSAGSLLDSWEGLFHSTVEAAHGLEDRAFHF